LKGVQIGRGAGEHQLRLRCCSLKRSTEISFKIAAAPAEAPPIASALVFRFSSFPPTLALSLSLFFLPVHTVLSPDDLRTRNRQSQKSIPKVNGRIKNKYTEYQRTFRKYANTKYGYGPNYAAVQRQDRPAPTTLLPTG
jgi:hypothetical protein